MALEIEYVNIQPKWLPVPGLDIYEADVHNTDHWVSNSFFAGTNAQLAHAPSNPNEVLVDPEGGPAQEVGVDFEVSPLGLLQWGLPESAIKAVSEYYPTRLRVAYERA